MVILQGREDGRGRRAADSFTSTCGTSWHTGTGQVQTLASVVARWTRAAVEATVSCFLISFRMSNSLAGIQALGPRPECRS